MDTQQFFERVVAPVGHLVIAALRVSPTGKSMFWNVGNFDAASAAQKVLSLDTYLDTTVYFAVGTQENNVDGKKITRKQATAAWFKALALDLDCGPGKPYATQYDGATALFKALATFNFPDPLLVNSGNGLHVYWPLETAIPAARWTKVSTALRLALRDGGVQIDESKIHDASMVLRPVGTHHKKQQPWKEVSVMADCPDYPNAELESKLVQWAGKINSAKLNPAAPAQPRSSIAAAILGGGFDPLNLDTVSPGCRQIAALLASGGATDAAGADVREPMWRASLGVAKYATDPTDAVTRLCGKHPDFDLTANLDKLARWGGTGPTTCAEFEKHCPSGCVGCPSKGQIKSPAQLSVQTQVTVAPAVVHTLPPGYFIWNDKVWENKEDVTEDGTPKTKRELVCNRPLVVLDRYTNYEKSEACTRWSVKQPAATEWRTYELPMALLQAGGTELMKYFGDKELIIGPMAMLIKLRAYMLSFLDYQQQTSESGLNMESYGWQKDGTFLCGNNLINHNGAAVRWRASKTLATLSAHVNVRGDRSVWAEMTRLLDVPDGHLIAFSLLVAGSGLLLSGSDIPAYVYAVVSEETGTGKTFSLRLGNTLFGHPTELMLQANDTENALYRIMGSMGSLSAAIDEITTMGEERAAAFAFQAQTGREKKRMNANAEIRDPVHWHAPLRVSSNKSLLTMYDNAKVKNEAETVRTLELRMDDKVWVSRHDMKTLTRLLTDNYGFAAAEVAAEIVRRGSIREVYDAATARFKQEFPHFIFEGDERFYAAGVIAAYGFGRIGYELGLFRFNIENCVDAALGHIESLRAVRVSKRQDCFDSIGQFLLEMNDRILVCREDRSNPANIRHAYETPVSDIAFVRVEIIKDVTNPLLPGSRLMINVAKLREWTKKTGEDYGGLIDRLTKAGALQHSKERVTLHKGTQFTNPGQAFCVVLNLCHPRFATVLNAPKAILNTNTTLAILQGGKTTP